MNIGIIELLQLTDHRTMNLNDELGQKARRDETVAFLALATIHGIGYWTLRKLAESCDSYAQLLRDASTAEFSGALKAAGCKLGHSVANASRTERDSLWEAGVVEYRDLREKGITVIHSKHPDFPIALRQIDEAPYWLFVQGDASILQRKAIALVGTRTPTDDGRFLATYLGSLLPRLGAVAVSGLAVGIDQIIHRAALRYKVPTVAFLGHGLLARYQSGGDELRAQILDCGGAIVSEYLPRQSFSSENFVRRNRLQTGLSSIVVPVEWREKSGTSHTVKYASQQGKPLMCVRLPDWNGRDELKLAARMGGTIFTVPGDEERIFQCLENALNKNVPADPQLSLPI